MTSVVTLSTAVALCELNEEVFVQLTGYRQPFVRESTAMLAVEYVRVICSYADKVEAGAANTVDRMLMQSVDQLVRAVFRAESEFWDNEYRKAEGAARKVEEAARGVAVQRIRNVLIKNGIDPDAVCDREYRKPGE